MTYPLRVLIGALNTRQVGGAETYLEAVLSGLHDAGHEVRCLFELDGDPARPPVRVPQGVPVYRPGQRKEILAELAAWRPDVVFIQGLQNPKFEAAVQRLAPAVLYAHAYHGTCASGTKAWTRPEARACSRRFGLGCLVHYFPHGCGGANPMTMTRLYRAQRRRNRLLTNYKTVLVASRHMAGEFRRHVPSWVKVLRLECPFTPPAIDPGDQFVARVTEFAAGVRTVRLVFLGRLEPNKGAMVAIAAAQWVAGRLGRAVELTLIGDGAERELLEKKIVNGPTVVRFAGWQGGSGLAAELSRADLLLVPSLWPEPFGLSGLEAGWYGVPAAGFAHGGIPDWLHDGETGALASADPPTAEGLADAAVRCLSSPEKLLRMSRAARSAALDWPRAPEHARGLVEVFEEARLRPHAEPRRGGQLAASEH